MPLDGCVTLGQLEGQRGETLRLCPVCNPPFHLGALFGYFLPERVTRRNDLAVLGEGRAHVDIGGLDVVKKQPDLVVNSLEFGEGDAGRRARLGMTNRSVLYPITPLRIEKTAQRHQDRCRGQQVANGDFRDELYGISPSRLDDSRSIINGATR